MELDLIFSSYLKEENSNILHYNDILVYRYSSIVASIYYVLLKYVCFVWFVLHHKKLILNNNLNYQNNLKLYQ